MPKRRRRLMTGAVLAGVVAFALPVATALHFSVAEGEHDADVELGVIAGDMLRRAATLRTQFWAVIDQLSKQDSGEVCTEADIERMRSVFAASGYIRAVGRVRGDRLLCSTLTGTRPVELGPFDRRYPVPDQPQSWEQPMAWDRVAMPGIAGPGFSVYARDGYAAISVPELISDISAPPGVVIGQVAVADRKVMRSQGTIDPAWVATLPRSSHAFHDGRGHRVFVRISDLGHTAAVVAMPEALIDAHVREAATTRLPLGLLVGTLLATLVGLYAYYLLSLKARLRRALRLKQFYVVYQPVIDLRDGHCVGAEALVRWNDPDMSGVGPSVFIPAAEKHGLIQQVTQQVMAIVAREAAALLQVFPDVHIAVNVSPADMHAPDMEAQLDTMLALAGASARNIMIEVTERGMIKPEQAKRFLASVRARGFRVAIDDFGTGNSSLSYLATYDLDALKIDKMFIDAFEDDSPTAKVAFHIIEMARTLGLEMIAEGVETERQRDTLRASGVHYAQGWLFARPMPMPELMAFIGTQGKKP